MEKKTESEKPMTIVIVSFSASYRLLSLANGAYFHDHLAIIQSIQSNIRQQTF